GSRILLAADSASSPHRLHRLPTRRSSDLPAHALRVPASRREGSLAHLATRAVEVRPVGALPHHRFEIFGPHLTVRHRILDHRPQDRKSTRLNSSHVKTSYAVFCLKKKSTR